MAIFQIRDVLNLPAENSVTEYEIALRCVLISRKKTKSMLFLTLQDETGVLQGVYNFVHDDRENWERLVGLEAGQAVQVAGVTTSNFSNAKMLIRSVDSIGGELAFSVDHLSRLTAGSPGAQLYVARLLRILTRHFDEQGFVEIAARIITSSPPPSPGMFPLRAHYHGFGTPFYISPSPAPQVVRALGNLPYSGIYSVSRCFTQDYRDPAVSVESCMITIGKRSESVGSLLGEIDALIRDILDRPETKGTFEKEWPRAFETRHPTLDSIGTAAVSVPTIQLFDEVPGPFAIANAGRLCWPVKPETHIDFSEHVLAEGYTAGSNRTPAYALISVNIDRVLATILDKAELRQIPALHEGGRG